MNRYLSSASLKALAKGQLLGKYGTVIGAYLFHLLCTMPISLALFLLIDTDNLPGILIYGIASFIFNLFVGYFVAGESYIYLKIACSQPPMINDLFYFFRNDTSKILYLQVVLTGVSTLCSLPALIAGHCMDFSMGISDSGALTAGRLPAARLLVLYMVLYIAGSMIDIYVRLLLLSQVFYLTLDFPEHSVPQLLKMSIRLMKGSKARLFYILLSFIPLSLLGMLSCGIALLWIYPYMQATYANFYLDMIKKKK